MPLRETAPVGAPCWIDLLTSDPDRSRAFYTELFGWKAEEPNAEFGGYWNFVKDDILIAGGMRNDGSSGAPDTWSIYLATDNAQATIDAATAKGSQVIVPAMPVGDLGTMGVVTDPGGAAIGLWKPGTHKGFGIYDEPNTPGWFELHTRKYDESVAFYHDVFKWTTHTVSDEPEFRYTTLGEGDGQLAGMMDGTAYLPVEAPAAWSIYFRVDDTDAALRQIEGLGGTVTEPAQDTPYGRLAAANDPTGARFKLMAGA
ncbi:MAG TPA: VOC family protein [Acidimicrobiia bacterium]|nr:VOC family protein [Acidimicrobiia bacterium]